MFIQTVLAVLSAFLFAFSQLTFTTPPSFTDNGGTWTIAFAVSESTDVEVSIVRLGDSTVVRHLAAGVLGPNPPAPLQANSLSQTLTWDGRDDLGIAVVDTESLTVHVRAGMSPDLDRFVGGNPYAFMDGCGGYWSFNGIYSSSDGRLYVLGSGGPDQFFSLREYDGAGVYSRTVFPPPAGLSAPQVSGWGVNTWTNGLYSPKTTRLPGPGITSGALGSFGGATLVPLAAPGELALIDYNNLQFSKINADGSIAESPITASLVTSPALPGGYNRGGPRAITLSQDGKFVYLSGFYYNPDGTWGPRISSDTGFWQDGRVFKVDLLTGTASVFLSLDSVPTLYADRDTVIGPIYAGSGATTCAAIHGTAVDDSGRVFICDRLHQRIGVYDTNGTYLAGVPIKYADYVEYDKATGALFVTTRLVSGYHSGFVRLYKFPGWRGNPAPACSVTLCTNGMGEFSLDKTFLVLTHDGPTTLAWVGYHATGVRAFRDDNTALTLVKDFYAATTPTLGFDRLAVDRRREDVYFTNSSWYIIHPVVKTG